jgi:metal-responsive CopG/Arc/MetJ family transcriptional regulator
MPRVKVSIPDPLLQVAADAAQAAGKKIDDLYVVAIAEFIKANQHTRPGALRNRGKLPISSPRLTIEIPEELFQEAEKLAKRLGKRRDAIYALALEQHLAYASNAQSALDQGHDLPTGAWRSGGSA